MRLQRKLEVLSAALLLSAAAGPTLADAGLGAAFTNGSFDTGTTILVPIRMKGMLIEPQLAYLDTKNFGNTGKALRPGVGLYLTKDIGGGYELYYGGIIAYDQTKTTTGAAPEQKSTSFILQPTIGAAHYFSKQFSLGVDAGLFYQDGTTKQSGAADQDIKNIGTTVRIIARAFFF